MKPHIKLRWYGWGYLDGKRGQCLAWYKNQKPDGWVGHFFAIGVAPVEECKRW